MSLNLPSFELALSPPAGNWTGIGDLYVRTVNGLEIIFSVDIDANLPEEE